MDNKQRFDWLNALDSAKNEVSMIYKKKRLYYILAGCCIIIILIFILRRFHSVSEGMDVQNTDTLKLASSPDALCNEVEIGVAKSTITTETKDISLEVENLSQNSFDIPANEMTIDRFLEGNWYFWGKCGNGLEGAVGALAKETVQLDYRLSADIFQDADFIETYDGKQCSKDGDAIEGMPNLAIILFPGKYRVRLKGCFPDLETGNSDLACEVLHEFVVE